MTWPALLRSSVWLGIPNERLTNMKASKIEWTTHAGCSNIHSIWETISARRNPQQINSASRCVGGEQTSEMDCCGVTVASGGCSRRISDWINLARAVAPLRAGYVLVTKAPHQDMESPLRRRDLYACLVAFVKFAVALKNWRLTMTTKRGRSEDCFAADAMALLGSFAIARNF